MEVQNKVCLNADEINQAKSKNEHYEKERQLNVKRVKKEKKLVPENVEVPEREIAVQKRLWDVKNIDEAYINELHEEKMISVVHLGKPMMIIYSDEVWKQLEERFNN